MKKTLILAIQLLFGLIVYAQTVKILGIGNSFTVDALEQHFQPILDSMGIDAIVAYPYKGGTELNMHDAWYQRDTAAYNYKKFTHGVFTTTGAGKYTLKKALQDEAWDYVMIQTDHNYSGKYAYYFPYLSNIISYVKSNCSNKDVKIGLYMTWAYDSSSTYKSFPVYNNNQQLMYDSIIACVKKALPEAGLEILIPSGTAVQNARTSYIGDHLNRDGYHLDYDYGRYITSLCWYETIFGDSATHVTYQPAGISDFCADMCRHAAHYAVLNPYEVSSLKEEYGKDPTQGDVVTWDFQNYTAKQTAIFNGGLTERGYTLKGVGTGTVNATKGYQMPTYTSSNPNTNYLCLSLPPQHLVKLNWTLREASTGSRSWTVYYMVVDSGTVMTDVDIKANATGIFGVHSKPSGDCNIFQLEKTIDLSNATTPQQIYFVHQCSNTGNNIGWCKLSMTLTNTESSLGELSLNGASIQLQPGVTSYDVEISAARENITLMAVPTVSTSQPNVYVGVEDIERTETRGLFYVPTPALNQMVKITIKVISQSPSHYTEYTVNATARNIPSTIYENQIKKDKIDKCLRNGRVYINAGDKQYILSGARIK